MIKATEIGIRIEKCLIALVILGGAGLATADRRSPAAEPQLRGVWMHATQIPSSEEADRWIERIDRANLNAVFLLVWYWGGQAAFHSELCPMLDGVSEGFDPLGYMVEQCHQRRIEVHAWFVNGAYGAPQPRYVLDEHPDWAVQAGSGTQLWYDFGKPEVRRFQSDLMIECLQRYRIDGLHFDYIRYGPKQCYCDHCQQEFADRYGFEPLTQERLKYYPVAGLFSGNPVDGPTTARVLAAFSSGVPAIATNRLGQGEVLLLNWHADSDMFPAVAETTKRIVQQWSPANNLLYLTNTDENRAKYGRRSEEQVGQLLRRLGYATKPVQADHLGQLPSGAVLVLPNVYIIPESTAEQLEEFVQKGGRAVFIDGPVFSIKSPAMQRVLGMSKTARYFHGPEAIVARGPDALVPSCAAKVDLESLHGRSAKWAEYRAWGVSQLVADVYARAKALRPDVQITAAVFTPLESAQGVFQDWPGWLRRETIDFVIPMAYTMDTAELGRQIDQWKTVDPALDRIVPGLSLYQKTPQGTQSRPVELVFQQRELCAAKGARGNVYFSLQYLSDELADALRRGPYAEKSPPYRPNMAHRHDDGR